MEKWDPKKDAGTPDIVGQNIETLKELCPEVITEGKVDFDALRETLGDYIDDRPERYSFTWNGKSRARRIAQTPSTGTLRPCPEESVNWDTTHNLFIEGDNLEVLKLLQKSYHKKVKMIYIDPPYNTGNEFIYPDKFQDNLGTYLRYTGQIDDEGFKLSANTDTSGRYHTNWLNMMYPRLKLARSLLRDDGVMFISIDDNEVSNLRKLCDELFGEENFVANIVWQKKYAATNDAKGFSVMHDHIIVYQKTDSFERLLLPRTAEQNKPYKHDDNDGRGLWRSDNLLVKSFSPSGVFAIVNPNTGQEFLPPEGSCWRGNKETINRWLDEKRIFFGKDGTGAPQLKRYLNEVQQGRVPVTWWPFQEVGHNDAANKELKALFTSKAPFDTPKPSSLIAQMLRISTTNEDICMDFFSGSCTTAHSVLDLNKGDAGNRKFIMVQLPEPCDQKSEAFKAGYKTIADIGKERIRRVIRKIEAEQTQKAKDAEGNLPGMANEVPKLDLGFKVFKLDASNIIPWDADFDNLENALFNAVENIKRDRSQADVLYELLLKYGLDLAVLIEERKIGGKTVYIIGAGALIVCLAKQITLGTVEGIAALKEELKPEVMRVVFKDSGFKNDVVKTNTVQILRQAGIEDVKSL